MLLALKLRNTGPLAGQRHFTPLLFLVAALGGAFTGDVAVLEPLLRGDVLVMGLLDGGVALALSLSLGFFVVAGWLAGGRLLALEDAVLPVLGRLPALFEGGERPEAEPVDAALLGRLCIVLLVFDRGR